VITLDTSGIIAYINAGDRAHQACRETLEQDMGPWIIPAAVLAEVGWFLETKLPPIAEHTFLDDLRDHIYTTDWHAGDIPRIHDLVERYRDLKLGIADAAVIACAERNIGRVLTTDRRHFPVVARGEGTITVLPA
jgi:predicted nucleic acid-binding protein